ncbi:unnamed protein product [Trifolium pratense]|uniref:Uncharacterized protein n=1 Tax=Trifolium pratense TaxID=57577 RepID=A0ACB0JE15_TRIPR|nr:unnamed protein product [Trifolium pratense]
MEFVAGRGSSYFLLNRSFLCGCYRERVEVRISTIDSSDNNEFLQIEKSNFISLVVKILTFFIAWSIKIFSYVVLVSCLLGTTVECILAE